MYSSILEITSIPKSICEYLQLFVNPKYSQLFVNPIRFPTHLEHGNLEGKKKEEEGGKQGVSGEGKRK